MVISSEENNPNKRLIEALTDVYNKMISECEPLGPEFQQVIDNNFWELLITDEIKDET